jgi:hypothetical protein
MQMRLGQVKNANRQALHALAHTDKVRKAVLNGHKIDKPFFQALGALSRSMTALLSSQKLWYEPKDLKELADDHGYVELLFSIHWSDLVERAADEHGIEGLNDFVDDEVLSECDMPLSDLTYKLVGVDIEQGAIYFKVTADAREIIERYEERLEEERRDEKRGLYGDKLDAAN